MDGDTKTNSGIHFGYYSRLVIKIIFFLVFFVIIALLLYLSIKYNQEESIYYSSNGTIDYKVYLKDNDFYENEYLESGMGYVSSIVDNIKIKYNYDFNVSTLANIDFSYDITAKLKIEDEVKDVLLYEKNYTLVENKKISLESKDSLNLDAEALVDYNKYNNISNKYISKYGVTSKSILVVYLNVKYNSKNDEEYKINGEDKYYVEIPLSQKTININIVNNNSDKQNQVIKASNYEITNNVYIIIAGILFLIEIFIFFSIIKTLKLKMPKKSKYDKYVSNILKNYDRFIANTTYLPDFKDYEIVKIEKFEELIDIRDNLKLPIMYYVVHRHQKCYFYIKDNKTLFLTTIKNVDLENDEKEDLL